MSRNSLLEAAAKSEGEVTATGLDSKIGAFICSIKFISPGVALYLYKSTIWPCVEYCCHAWAVGLNC